MWNRPYRFVSYYLGALNMQQPGHRAPDPRELLNGLLRELAEKPQPR